jgi:hypothetical protein
MLLRCYAGQRDADFAAGRRGSSSIRLRTGMFFCHTRRRNGRAIFSLPYVNGGRRRDDLQLREDTPHAYDRNRIDCGRDAGRGHGYCQCADIHHNDALALLGQRDKAGAQRDPEHDLGQQHQQHERQQHQFNRRGLDL